MFPIEAPRFFRSMSSAGQETTSLILERLRTAPHDLLAHRRILSLTREYCFWFSSRVASDSSDVDVPKEENLLTLKDGRRLLSSSQLRRLCVERLMSFVDIVVREAFMMASEKGALKSSWKRGLRRELVGLRSSSSGCLQGIEILRSGFRDAIIAVYAELQLRKFNRSCGRGDGRR